MSTTKAATKAAALKISTVGDFKKRLGGITELPSGLVVRLHNPGGLTAFLGSGIIPNSLMPLVTKQVNVNKGETTEAALEKELEDNPDLLLGMTQMLDGVAAKCIVEPLCHPTPKEGEKRDSELLYADEIPMTDKQFIFAWVTSGVTELEPFRQ